MMRDHEKFTFTIYHAPVHMTAKVRGKKQFLQHRAFLDDLVAPTLGRRQGERPVPDPSSDFYMLDDQQMAAYTAFRRRLRRERNGFGP
jgi:hypothetical protein